MGDFLRIVTSRDFFLKSNRKKKLAVPEILHQSRQIGKHQEPGRQGIKETWL